LAGKTGIADYMVIASGTSSKHASSLADKVLKLLKLSYNFETTAEGIGRGDWVLIDAGDVIIHVFKEDVREIYNLEKMWMVPAPKPESFAVVGQ
jgi:ribosome-associated protein